MPTKNGCLQKSSELLSQFAYADRLERFRDGVAIITGMHHESTRGLYILGRQVESAPDLRREGAFDLDCLDGTIVVLEHKVDFGSCGGAIEEDRGSPGQHGKQRFQDEPLPAHTDHRMPG